MGFLHRILLMLLLLPFLNAFVVINSQDPLDASSGISYANARGEGFYLVYPGSDLIRSLAQIGNPGDILLIEPQGKGVLAGLQGSLEANGNRVDRLSLTGSQLNIELAKRSGTRKFIITDPVYGYNIVSVIPYAKSTGSFLIFANETNIGEASAFLSSNRPDYILFYGAFDESVPAALSPLAASTESIDNGDRYEDNMQLLDKYFYVQPDVHDVLLSDGAALEESINQGDFPVILISQVIPDSLYSFIKEKVGSGQIKVGTLIGSANIDAVYDMTKRMNVEFGEKKFSVYVKFGQATAASREPSPLSMFPLPFPYAQISLDEANYNPASGAFELVYSNSGNAQAYVKSTIAVLLNGQQVGTVGDDQSYVIRRGEKKGMSYSFANPGEGQLSINDTTYYGISRNSFDKGFIKYMDVGRISFVDQSSMLLSDASYSPWEDKLTVKVRNNGDKDTFYRLTVAYVNDEGLTVYEEEKLRNLSSGRNDIITLAGVVQLPSDKADGTTMNVTAAYGAREAFIEKQASADVKIEGFPLWILLILLLIILLIIAYWYYRKKKKEKEAQEPVAAQKKK